MGRRDRRHSGRLGRAARWLAAVVVVALAAGAVGVYRFDLADRWLPPREAPAPAAIAPPEELDLPAMASATPVAVPVTPARLDAGAVRRALAPYLSDRDLGRHVLAAVAPLRRGPVTTVGAGAAIPASTTKVLTSMAALDLLDPATTFATRVVRSGERLTLVGGGDPLLAAEPPEQPAEVWPARADLVTLAARTARALRADGVRRVRLGFDDTLFAGPAVSERWRADYIPDDIVSPVSALWADQGREQDGSGDRVDDPPQAAALLFAAALADQGVRVRGTVLRRPAPAAASEVARVESAPLVQLVEHLLLVSDNEASEVLLRHVGLASGGDGSFDGGVAGVRAVLQRHGVPLPRLVLHDGSGLSRHNRVAPATLVGALRVAATEPRFGALLTGLPVAGFSGSLSLRFDEGPAEGRGRVRAKTGTLTGVTSLAGIATDVDGTPMVFALMADRVRKPLEDDARDAMDSAAAALAACHCAR